VITDDQLLARVQSGQSAALELLFHRYADRVYGFAYGMLHAREDAEEVVTETFIRVFRFAGEFRAEGSFHSWLFRIAKRLCLDRLRQPKLVTLPLQEWDQPEDDIFEEERDRSDMRQLVRQALSCLSEDYRAVLIMRDVQGLSNREVAEAIGKSEVAAKSLHHRARRALRDALRENVNDERSK
jgi:RNA polymerase sigma-70 factor, ECF subfamily